MSILSGFFKTIKYRMTDQGYKWQSEKTSSQTVVMGDGTDNTDTAEKRFGAIKGLTSSTSVTDTGYALDATIGKKHEDSIAALNQSLSDVNSNLSKIQSGVTTTVGASGSANIKLNVPYSNTNYTVIATVEFKDTASKFCVANVYKRTNDTFTIYTFDSATNTSVGGVTVSWVAIGN